MASGHDRYVERVQKLSSFGRDLTRRSGSKCELCHASGVPLVIWELPPVPADPDFGTCIFLCERCRDFVEKNPFKDTDHWRCLNEAVWSDVTAVKILAVRLLRKIAVKESWAGELLEQVYLDEDEEEWAARG